MKKTLLIIVATVVGTIAVLAVALYTYIYLASQPSEAYAAVQRDFYTRLDTQDYAGAERVLLDAVANETFADPVYQFSLHTSLAGLQQEYMKNVSAAEKHYRAAFAIDLGEAPVMLLESKADMMLYFAVMLDESGRYDVAVKYFQEALAVTKNVNPVRELQIFIAMGVAYVHLKDFDRGEFYLEEARKRAGAREPADLGMKGLIYNNLAWMYLRSARHDKALDAAQSGLRIAEVLNDKSFLATIYDTRAQILLALNCHEEALSDSERSLITQPGTDYMFAVHYRTHGIILASLDRKAEGCKSLAKALELYVRAGNDKEHQATRREADALAC